MYISIKSTQILKVIRKSLKNRKYIIRQCKYFLHFLKLIYKLRKILNLNTKNTAYKCTDDITNLIHETFVVSTNVHKL